METTTRAVLGVVFKYQRVSVRILVRHVEPLLSKLGGQGLGRLHPLCFLNPVCIPESSHGACWV